MSKLSLPESVTNLIDSYFNLKFSDTKKVKSPYFRNYRKIGGMKLRALSGKGKPDEIVAETKIHSHLAGFNWRNEEPETIREFMLKKDIGIDCSGLVTWLIYRWFKDEHNLDFFKYARRTLKKGFGKWLRLLLRPVQNIDVLDLTSLVLSEKVGEVSEIKPGDFIRSKQGKHILMVAEVRHDEKGVIDMIEYVHSSDMYGKENGIRKGQIKITDPGQKLRDQTWEELDEEGNNWTHKGFLDDDGENGVFRLKLFEKFS